MDAVRVFKDGRREPIKDAAGERIIFPKNHADGHWTETTFHYDRVEGGKVIYVEGDTRDTTAEMEEARRRNEERTWEVITRGLGMSDEVDALRAIAEAACAYDDARSKPQRTNDLLRAASHALHDAVVAYRRTAAQGKKP